MILTSLAAITGASITTTPTLDNTCKKLHNFQHFQPPPLKKKNSTSNSMLQIHVLFVFNLNEISQHMLVVGLYSSEFFGGATKFTIMMLVFRV